MAINSKVCTTILWQILSPLQMYVRYVDSRFFMTVRLIETVHKNRIFQDQTLIQYYLLVSKNEQHINVEIILTK